MTMSVEFIHSSPQREIASRIQEFANKCETMQIVSAYVSSDGIYELKIDEFSEKITHLVIGDATFKAFLALDKMIRNDLPPCAPRVHLGYMPVDGSAVKSIQHYRPMLHSKIYFFNLPNKMAAAFIGSHNMTKPALSGLNGEAGVLLQGELSEPIFTQIRSNILESYEQAIPYDEDFKDAYVSWSKRHYRHIIKDLEEEPGDQRKKRNLIMAIESPKDKNPEKNDRIYFEISPSGTQVNFINTEVHAYFFDKVPVYPLSAILSKQYHAALKGKVNAIDADSGAAELEAKWCIDDISSPQLQLTERPFRPVGSKNKKQICVIIEGKIGAVYEYEIDKGRKRKWEPISDKKTSIDNWTLVVNLKEKDEPISLLNNPSEQRPGSESPVLFSKGRRNITKISKDPSDWKPKSETSWKSENDWTDLFVNVIRYFADIHEGKEVSFYESAARIHNNYVSLKNENDFRYSRELDSEYCINTNLSTKQKKRVLARLANLVVVEDNESNLEQLIDLRGTEESQRKLI